MPITKTIGKLGEMPIFQIGDRVYSDYLEIFGKITAVTLKSGKVILEITTTNGSMEEYFQNTIKDYLSNFGQ